MSRLTDLIAKVKASDAELGKELEREFKTLSARLPFGLNFERHCPIAQRLPHTVEPIRLYEAYLTNFRFAVGR